MYVKLVSTALALIGLSVSSITLAQEEEAKKGSWRYSGHISAVGIDSSVASAEGIKSAAISLGFIADYKKSDWVTSIGLDYIKYSDNESFSQTVEGAGIFNNGDISTESSDANAILFSVATGYEWRFREEKDVAVLLQGGFGHVFASERAIPNCISGCIEESIDVEGGVFVKAMATKETENFGFSVYAQQFLTGDGLSNALGFVFSNKF